MRNTASNDDLPAKKARAKKESAQPSGSQTLLRGLDVMDAVADGPIALADLAKQLGLTRSTTHRLANALIDRRYLTFTSRLGYQLGPKLLELGFRVQGQTDIVQVARPHLEELAAATGDTIHLGIKDGEQALYLDKISGRRRIEISSRIGERQPLTCTGLGKALLLDESADTWQPLFDRDQARGMPKASYDTWLERMKEYSGSGRAYDLEENEDQIRCVAAPIRNAAGAIVGALSVSSAAQYMADERMRDLSQDVIATARAISGDLGWTGGTPTRRAG